MTDKVVALEFRGVTRRFRSTVALDGIDLVLRSHSLVGLVGRNGAGKSTLLRLATGLIVPTSGRLGLFGIDLGRAPGAVAGRVGYVDAGDRGLPPRLSPRAGLLLFATLHGVAARDARTQIDALEERLAGGADWNAPFQSLSTGQRQRVTVARGLLGRPGVILLDEPTKALDTAGAELVLEIARERAEGGALVVISSHDLAGLEAACDELVVLERGRIVAQGAPERILPQHARPGWSLEFACESDRDRAVARFSELECGERPQIAHASVETPSAELLKAPGVQLARRRRRLSLAEFVASSRSLRLDGAARESARGTALTRDLRRPGMVRAARATLAILRRDAQTEFSYRFRLVLQFLLTAAWGTGVYFMARTFRVDGEFERNLHGNPFGFLLIGLVAMEVSNVAIGRVATQLREEQLLGTLEPLLATGRSPLLLLGASLAWPLAVALGLAALVLVSALVWTGEARDARWLEAGCATVVAASAVAALGLVSASFVHVVKRGDPVGLLVNLLGLLTAGAYFPREVLPSAVQNATDWSPYTTGIAAVRSSLLDGAGWSDAAFATPFGRLLAFAAIAVPFGIATWHVADRTARRSGRIAEA